MKSQIKKYLAEIGSKGGKACKKRVIPPEQQARMQAARKRSTRTPKISRVNPSED